MASPRTAVDYPSPVGPCTDLGSLAESSSPFLRAGKLGPDAMSPFEHGFIARSSIFINPRIGHEASCQWETMLQPQTDSSIDGH